MKYIKDPLTITVILTGIIIVGAALAGSANHPGIFYALVGVWVALAVVSGFILRRRYGRS